MLLAAEMPASPSPVVSPRDGPTPQPIFSRRVGGGQVTDPGLVRRGLGGVAQAHDADRAKAEIRLKLEDDAKRAKEEQLFAGAANNSKTRIKNEEVGGSSSSTAADPKRGGKALQEESS